MKTYARFLFVAAALVGSSPAATITPIYYNIPNGASGEFAFLDSSYTCQNIVPCSPASNAQINNAPLMGGLGKLTDGVVATQNWDVTPNPYVGWDTNPTLSFFFAPGTTISAVTIYYDDSGGAGDVSPPSSVTFTAGSNTITDAVATPSQPTFPPLSQTFQISSLDATTNLIISPIRSTQWEMISEISFTGTAAAVPEPSTLALTLGGAVFIAIAFFGTSVRQRGALRCAQRDSGEGSPAPNPARV